MPPMNAANDIQDKIRHSPMNRAQWTAIVLAIVLNGLDGYDAASISFVAPGMMQEWGLQPDILGWVLSMELIGMGIGSLFFGNVADRCGRRPTILCCLIIMLIGMTGAVYAGDVLQLSLLRVLTGLGIGGMMSSLAAIVSEHSNDRHRSLALSLMVVGYPMGLVLGGLVARYLLQVAHWSSVFAFGAIITAIMIPLAWAAVPESVAWLVSKRPRKVVHRVNVVLRRFDRETIETISGGTEPPRGTSELTEILRPPLARITILLTFAYFTHVSCLYFIFKWIPPLIVNMGYSPVDGADVLIWTMIGAAVSGPVFSIVANLISVFRATLFTLLGSAISVSLFTSIEASLIVLTVIAVIVGMFVTSASIGFYSLLATSFPAELRATGTGFGIGVGRAGASLGPAVAGILFAHNLDLPIVGSIMAAGSILSIVFILALQNEGALKAR